MARKANATSYGQKDGNRGNQSSPGSGRPPKVFTVRLRTILERNKTVANIEAILNDPDHPQFMKALEYATDRAHGKVPNTNEHTGEVVVRVVRDEAT